MSVAGFWNSLEVVNWNEDEDTTSSLGDLQIYGIEPQLSYQWVGGKIGASYSFVQQYDWELESGVLSSSISYSDYNQPLRDSAGVQTGIGDELNNWPNHSIKFFGNIHLSNKLILHVDGRFQSEFQDAKDGLKGLRNAVAGQPEEAEVLLAIQKVEDEDIYDYQIRLNATLSYEMIKGLSVRIYAQNLLGNNNRKRYAFDTGINRASPHRVRFTEEPRTFGVRMDYKF